MGNVYLGSQHTCRLGYFYNIINSLIVLFLIERLFFGEWEKYLSHKSTGTLKPDPQAKHVNAVTF